MALFESFTNSTNALWITSFFNGAFCFETFFDNFPPSFNWTASSFTWDKNVIDITGDTDGYTIENGEVYLDLGLINCLDCHAFIDIYGYCNC